MNLKLIKSLAHHAILHHKTEMGNASTGEQEIYNKNLVAESHDTLGHRNDNIYLFFYRLCNNTVTHIIQSETVK